MPNVTVTPVTRPIAVSVPPQGAFFAESVHAERFQMAWRHDAFHKCIYVLKGAVVCETRSPGQRTVLRAGSVAAISAGHHHRLQDREPSTLLLLCLGRDWLDADAELAAVWTSLLRPRKNGLHPSDWVQARVNNLWRHAILEQSIAQPACQVVLRAVAAQILVQFSRVRVEKTVDDAARRVAAVGREIEDSFFDEWNLDRAAARAEMSRRAFSERFRVHAGKSFLEQLTELRLNHAARLLARGHHSIVGAAFSSGYSDLSHFYRLFRQRYGMTPKTWSERHVKNGRSGEKG